MTDFINTYASAAEKMQSGELAEEEYYAIEKELAERRKASGVTIDD